MDDRSAEQRQADDNLLEAITAVINLKTPSPDFVEQGPTIVMEFVVVAACSSITLQEHNSTQYAYCFKDSGNGPFSSPHHSLVGLFHQGLRYLTEDN